jgi:hypothetical protein
MKEVPSSLNITEFSRKAQLNIRLSEFEIPPVQDVLLVGTRAPIGPEAVRRMVDSMSPEQYEIIYLDHSLFEAMVVKKSLLKQIAKDKLLPIIIEEGERIATAEAVIKVQVNVIIEVNRGIEL